MSNNKINYYQKQKDLIVGEEGEKTIFDFLKENINKDIIKYTDKWNVKDYYLNNDKGSLIKEWELKTRLIEHNKYDTLVFGFNKYEHSIKRLECNIEQSYLFNCSDGIYEWELKDPILQKNEFFSGVICNKKRNDKPHKAIHIYTKYLKKLK